VDGWFSMKVSEQYLFIMLDLPTLTSPNNFRLKVYEVYSILQKSSKKKGYAYKSSKLILFSGL